jgi:uncharacterized protein YkwD
MRFTTTLSAAVSAGMICLISVAPTARAAMERRVGFGGAAGKTHTAHTRAGCRAIRTTAPGKAACTTDAALDTARIGMLDLINAERVGAGSRPLHLDGTLDTIAQWRSRDMIKRNYFSHQIPGAGTVFDVLNRDHVPFTSAGENIAMNDYITVYSLAQTIQKTNTDFMNSPEHRDNILYPRYTDIGIGVAFQHGTGKLILTEVFTQR